MAVQYYPARQDVKLFFKNRISRLKTGFDLVGAIFFFTAEHAENAEIVVIPEQRRDSLPEISARNILIFAVGFGSLLFGPAA